MGASQLPAWLGRPEPIQPAGRSAASHDRPRAVGHEPGGGLAEGVSNGEERRPENVSLDFGAAPEGARPDFGETPEDGEPDGGEATPALLGVDLPVALQN